MNVSSLSECQESRVNIYWSQENNFIEWVLPVVLLSGHVQRYECNEAGDLHEEVDEQSHTGVQSKGPNRRHVG